MLHKLVDRNRQMHVWKSVWIPFLLLFKGQKNMFDLRWLYFDSVKHIVQHSDAFMFLSGFCNSSRGKYIFVNEISTHSLNSRIVANIFIHKPTHIHGNLEMYQDETFWQTQYAVFHVRCGTDDDENNNSNKKKDCLDVVCYISSIIISSPFSSGGISSFTWRW